MKRSLALLLGLLAGLVPLVARADVLPATSTGSFTTISATPWLVLNGQTTCAVVLGGSGATMTIVPQVTSDSLANIAGGSPAAVTLTAMNSGALTANGSTTAGIAGQGITAIRLNVTAIASGTETYVVTCNGTGAAAGNPVISPGTNSIGTVGLNSGTSTVGQVGLAAVTGNGWTHYGATTVTAGTVGTICASACTLAGVSVSWATTSTAGQCFLTLYNATAPTVGTAFVSMIPVNTTTSGGYVAYAAPLSIGGAFTTALTYAITTTVTGNTACNTSASSLFVEAWYK